MPTAVCDPRLRAAPRKRGRTCGRCATRAWRKRHADDCGARTRPTFTPNNALPDASAIFFTYLRAANRPEPLRTAGAADVVPHWPDLAQPLTYLALPHASRERTRPAAEWRLLRGRQPQSGRLEDTR